MKKLLLGIFLSASLFACNTEKKEATDAAETVTATEPKTGDQLLELREGDDAKNALNAFARADIDGMTANYDENVRQLWSGGDSLVGKKAIQDYYKGRWKLIDSLSFSEHIVLPIKVNVQQSKYAPTGKWVLHWALANVKYKNGKKLSFWVHNTSHYNDAGKVDFIGQYIDRQPLLEATKGMQ